VIPVGAKIELGSGALCRQQTKDKMASYKSRGLSEDEVELLEIYFYQVCGDQSLEFYGNESAMYDFIAQETAAFLAANPAFVGMRALVQKEFIRLARLQ
jgi:hypothetical protein